jgi:hypothetical protein
MHGTLRLATAPRSFVHSILVRSACRICLAYSKLTEWASRFLEPFLRAFHVSLSRCPFPNQGLYRCPRTCNTEPQELPSLSPHYLPPIKDTMGTDITSYWDRTDLSFLILSWTCIALENMLWSGTQPLLCRRPAPNLELHSITLRNEQLQNLVDMEWHFTTIICSPCSDHKHLMNGTAQAFSTNAGPMSWSNHTGRT